MIGIIVREQGKRVSSDCQHPETRASHEPKIIVACLFLIANLQCNSENICSYVKEFSGKLALSGKFVNFY